MTNGSSRKIIFAGIDDGFAETKISLSNGVNIKIPSQAKAGEMTQISIGGSSSGPTIYSYCSSDGDFTIGDIRDSDATAFDDYPMSAMNRVIVAHALRKAGVTEEYDVYAYSGLPVKKYYVSGKLNEKLIRQKEANLLKTDVVSNDGNGLCRIRKHKILAEGIAAWMDIVLQRNEFGKIVLNKSMASQRIAIIDIGGRTTDIAVIKDGQLDISRSSTIDVGMLAVRESLASAIHSRHDVAPTVEHLNDAMEKRSIRLWGANHGVGELVDQSTRSTVQRIRAEVKKCLGDGSDIDKVVFVGGTVVEIEPHLSGWFKNQSIGIDPSYANARGMQKFAEMTMLAG